METLEKRYGLLTAICMVVGIVIGSGIFFKTQDVLAETGGNVLNGVLAWVIGGIIMVTLASTFAVMATKYEKVGGVVDYAEATCGKTYAYFVGWFMSIIYFPAMTSVLAWVSARYTIVLVRGVSAGSPDALFGPECIVIAAVYLVLIYFINALAPKIAGKIQVSTTVAKLIPIAFIALVGTVIGLVNGTLVDNFKAVPEVVTGSGNGGMVAAVCCTAFAYEGWVIATTINAEIKNAKRNLPIALFIGSLIIVAAYVLYFLGVVGLEDTSVLMSEGTTAAFKFFGNAVAGIINFLIIFSCLGTLNGLMLACTRGTYVLAARDEGLSPSVFSQIDKKTNIPTNSATLGLLLCVIWLAYFMGSQFFGWFKSYAFDSSELPIIALYPMYIPILIRFMKTSEELGMFKRFVMPTLSIVSCAVMVIASVLRHKISNVWFLIVFAVVMLLGAVVYFWNKKTSISGKKS